MTPIATVIPPAAANLPPEVLLRPAEAARLRSVEPATRLRPQQQRPTFEALAELRERSPDAAGDRRRQVVPAKAYLPARPSAGGFLAQLLSQQSAEETGAQRPALQPDASGRGSEAYRRAGAEPAAFSEAPEIFRILA